MSTWKNIVGRYGSSAGETADVRIDSATDAMIGITYVHHEIHAGRSYENIDVVDLAINNVRDLQIVTPDTTRWSHMYFSLHVESETDWYLYEDVAINTPGTAATLVNMDRNSSNTAGMTIRYIDNTSVANANSDTAVAGATELQHGTLGAGKDAGVYDHGHELILKQNTNYCARFIANAAGYVAYHFDWYEHTNRR